MEGFVRWCVNFYREKLRELLLEEPQTFDDLHNLVQRLVELQEEFNEVIEFVEDIANWDIEAMFNIQNE